MRLGVLERVGILLRANLSEVLARAEDPQETLRQVIADIQNQLLQVKSRMAVALSDQVALERLAAESAEKASVFLRKAAAGAKGTAHDEAAKSALQKALVHRRASEQFAEQVRAQKVEVDTLRSMFLDLEHKLAEAKANGALLLANQRRALKSVAVRTVSPSPSARKADEPITPRVERSQKEHELDELLLEMKRARRG